MATYSFQDVNATLVGTGVINLGYGAANAEEGITIEMGGDKNTMMIGADGEGMHSLHADKSGQITVRLLKTSPQNAKLMAMYAAQTAASNLHGQNTITITNSKSGDVTVGRECAFKKKPSIVYAKDGNIMEWVFDCIKIDTILGTF
jgi:predicted porin